MVKNVCFRFFLLVSLACIIFSATSCNMSFNASMGGGDYGEENADDEYVGENGGSNSFVNGGAFGGEYNAEDGYSVVIKGYDEDGRPIVSVIDPNGNEVDDNKDGENEEYVEETQAPVEQYELPDGTTCDKNLVSHLEDGSVAVPARRIGEMTMGHKVFKPDGTVLVTQYFNSIFEESEFEYAYIFMAEYYSADNTPLKKVKYQKEPMKVLESEEYVYDVVSWEGETKTYRARTISLADAGDGLFYKTVYEYLPDFDPDKPVHSKKYETDGSLYGYSDYVYKMGEIACEERMYNASNVLEAVLTTYESGEKIQINYNNDGSIFNELYYDQTGHLYSAKYYYHNGDWGLTSYDETGSIIRSEDHYADGKVEVTEYDENHKMKSGTITNPDGSLYATVTYEHYDYTGRERYFKHNANGVLIEDFERFYENGIDTGILTREYYENGVVARHYEYRTSDQWTLEITYDINGNVINRFEHKP